MRSGQWHLHFWPLLLIQTAWSPVVQPDPSVTVSSIAGQITAGCTASPGYRDGVASSALFHLPSRVQVVTERDTERLYILDDSNGCVRSMPLGLPAASTRVRTETPCGNASTIAHRGPDARWPNGTSRGWSWVDGPQDFVVTPEAIYMLDTYNNQVKASQLSQTTGRYGHFETVAGTGAVGSSDGPALEASFAQPHGLALAPRAGVLYVADTFASCIRAINLQSGVVTTVAGLCGVGGHRDGTGLEARFNHPHKVTLDPTNQSVVYVADAECFDDAPMHLPALHESGQCGLKRGPRFTGVRRLELASGGGVQRVHTVAGFFGERGELTAGFRDGEIATAQFHYVHDLALRPVVDGEGPAALYVADFLNSAIREIDLGAGVVRTLAGNGTKGCADGDGSTATFNPTGLSVSRDGSIYVADYHNNRIRKLTQQGS